MKAAIIFVVLCILGIVSSVQACCDNQSVDAAVLLDNGTITSVESCGCSVANTGTPIATTNFEMTWRVIPSIDQWPHINVDLLGTVISKQDAEFTCAVLTVCDLQAYSTNSCKCGLNAPSRYNTGTVQWCSLLLPKEETKPSKLGRSVPTTFLASGNTSEIAFPNTFEQAWGSTVKFTVIFTDVTSGETFTCYRQVNLETLEITIPAQA